SNDASVARKMSAVDPITGDFVWDSGIADWVGLLKVQGSQLIVGGSFTAINGETRNGLALFSTGGGAPQLIGADYSGPLGVAYPYVSDAAISGSTLYAGGFKYSVGGVSRRRLLRADSQTGEPRSWNPSQDDPSAGGIFFIETMDSTIYVAGYFDKMMGESRNRIAAFDMVSGALKSWAPHFGSYPTFHNMAVSEGEFYVAGYFSEVNGQSRNGIAAFSGATGDLLSWTTDLEPDSYVSSMARHGDFLVLVGELIRNGERRWLGLADLKTGVFRSDIPQPNSSPWYVKSNGSRAFICGSFTRMD
ncbi:MAG TPA: hypothetical protein PL182_07590, partial [Pseudobdellovibrionaceae bacterium]|nr:hypothetical protein [Pseudobdellovibrionaceae bacterium]